MRFVKLAAGWLRARRNRGRALLTAARVWLLRTDVRRWRKVATQIPHWDDRNRVIAGFVPPGAAVLDLGCGAQTLRTHLKPDCHYQPCDIVASSPDVILCDF